MERSPAAVRLAVLCRVGDEAAIAALLAERPDLPRTLAGRDLRRVVDAAEEGDAAAVRRMLAAGWPVEARGHDGATALHFAAWRGDLAMTRELLRRSPPLDLRDGVYEAPPIGWALHGSVHASDAAPRDHAGVVRALLEAGATAPRVDAETAASDAVRAVLRRHAAG
jgi:hypothetical protein